MKGQSDRRLLQKKSGMLLEIVNALFKVVDPVL
jgi:hypothetical protein